MKKSFLVTLLFAIGLFANAQTPPKAVVDAFNKKFTSATESNWEQGGKKWEVEFKNNGVSNSATFDATGKWCETETAIKVKEIPAEVLKVINKKFAGWEIEEAESIEKPDFNGYELILEKGETEVEVVVSASGELTISKVTVEDDEEDDKKEDKEK